MIEKDVHSELWEKSVERQLILRKARVSDVGAMHRIISHYAEQHLMLPKTPLVLYETLRITPSSQTARGPMVCWMWRACTFIGRILLKSGLWPWRLAAQKKA